MNVIRLRGKQVRVDRIGQVTVLSEIEADRGCCPRRRAQRPPHGVSSLAYDAQIAMLIGLVSRAAVCARQATSVRKRLVKDPADIGEIQQPLARGPSGAADA